MYASNFRDTEHAVTEAWSRQPDSEVFRWLTTKDAGGGISRGSGDGSFAMPS